MKTEQTDTIKGGKYNGVKLQIVVELDPEYIKEKIKEGVKFPTEIIKDLN